MNIWGESIALFVLFLAIAITVALVTLHWRITDPRY